MPRGMLMIVIDCLRADHVSCYGYARPTTPTLDRLAEDGVLWERAYSTSSWTKPSVVSLLTGRYVADHGAYEGIKRSKGRWTTTDVLCAECPTMAQTLQAEGWRCAAFINNAQLGDFVGLHRGFDHYVSNAGKADALIGQFLTWLDHDSSPPFFAYLHLLEAHWPYKPRRRHVQAFGGDRDASHFRDFSARDYGRLRRSLAHGECALSPEHLEDMVRMYDAAVRRLDGKIKRVLGELSARGYRDELAVLVTADHGEEFMDHGRIGHGHALHEELLRVPMVLRPIGGRPRRIGTAVSHVDVVATLLGCAGVADPGAGRDLLQHGVTGRPVVSELRIRRRYWQAIRQDGWVLQRQQHFASPETCEAYTRFQDQDPGAGAPECQIELLASGTAADDAARQSLGQPHVQARLEASLDSWREELRASRMAGVGCDVPIDAAVVERLRDLGYID